MFLTFSDLNEDRRAGEGTLSSPSISEFILLGLSSGFHLVVFRFSHYPSVLGNSKKKKSIGLVTPRTDRRQQVWLRPCFCPGWLRPQRCPFTPSAVGQFPGAEGDAGWD